MILSFHLPIAPRLLQRCHKCGFIPAETFGKSCKHACLSFLSPMHPCIHIPVSDDLTELSRQFRALCNLCTTPIQFVKIGLRTLWFFQNPPRSMSR